MYPFPVWALGGSFPYLRIAGRLSAAGLWSHLPAHPVCAVTRQFLTDMKNAQLESGHFQISHGKLPYSETWTVQMAFSFAIACKMIS